MIPYLYYPFNLGTWKQAGPFFLEECRGGDVELSILQSH